MNRNIIKVLDKKFSDMPAGTRMLISSPEKIIEYIKLIPKGCFKDMKQMRKDLAQEHNADHTCPISTGMFLRIAIERLREDFPYWRVIDSKHPIVKKLNLDSQRIDELRTEEMKK